MRAARLGLDQSDALVDVRPLLSWLCCKSHTLEPAHGRAQVAPECLLADRRVARRCTPRPVAPVCNIGVRLALRLDLAPIPYPRAHRAREVVDLAHCFLARDGHDEAPARLQAA